MLNNHEAPMERILLSALLALTPALLSAQGIALDQGFGTRGVTRTSFGEAYTDRVYDMLVQPDGKIVTVGTSDGAGSLWVAIARYLPNGRHDLTFGDGGRVLYRADFRDEGRSIAMFPDGGYIVVGVRNQSNAGSGITPTVYRFKSDGALDTTFGAGGRAVHRFDPISGGEFDAVGVRSDGMVLAGGWSSGNINGGLNGFAVRRFSVEGEVDSTVGINGVSRVALENLRAPGAGLFTSDGKMLLSGLQFVGPDYVLTLSRFDTNGAPDATFGELGIATAEAVALATPTPSAVAVDSSGRMYATFTTRDTGSFTRLAVARFMSDGFADLGFGRNGIAFLTIGARGEAADIAIMRDGKVLIVGSSNEANGQGLIARLTENGAPDVTFGERGVLRASINGGIAPNSHIQVATLEGQTFITAGFESRNDRGDFTLARYTHLTTSAPAEERDNTSITIAPNPAGSIATVRVGRAGASKATWSLHDPLGACIRSGELEPGSDEATIDLGEFPSGAYALRVVIDGRVETRPLRIIH
jgi:uncharacterized delta-60 repeat protein